MDNFRNLPDGFVIPDEREVILRPQPLYTITDQGFLLCREEAERSLAAIINTPYGRKYSPAIVFAEMQAVVVFGVELSGENPDILEVCSTWAEAESTAEYMQTALSERYNVRPMIIMGTLTRKASESAG